MLLQWTAGMLPLLPLQPLLLRLRLPPLLLLHFPHGLMPLQLLPLPQKAPGQRPQRCVHPPTQRLRCVHPPTLT